MTAVAEQESLRIVSMIGRVKMSMMRRAAVTIPEGERSPTLAFCHGVIMLSLFLIVAPPLWAQSAGDGKDDPFYGQKGQYGATDVSQLLADSTQAIFQQVQESVAPFTGNLSLVHTDLVLPGNGGFDLNVRSVGKCAWQQRQY